MMKHTGPNTIRRKIFGTLGVGALMVAGFQANNHIDEDNSAKNQAVYNHELAVLRLQTKQDVSRLAGQISAAAEAERTLDRTTKQADRPQVLSVFQVKRYGGSGVATIVELTKLIANPVMPSGYEQDDVIAMYDGASGKLGITTIPTPDTAEVLGVELRKADANTSLAYGWSPSDADLVRITNIGQSQQGPNNWSIMLCDAPGSPQSYYSTDTIAGTTMVNSDVEGYAVGRAINLFVTMQTTKPAAIEQV